eukprot:CAMPEP_0197717660 /NCGR_PEP_ID=MMETSP1434-20131217/2120_1 /TAXON_ID=265543 /ORGANISM="Minutocellus polymorphus, Strain CCMP3303" /LENGTH=212 /DNA_ID=CAMNT_0043302223 /DNA_START=47 /DNA_END=685 /DNA_ORIENTATION=+
MFKSLAIATLAASASAFAPAQTGKASTQLAAFENELGVQPPLGFFDPLGLLEDADQERFDRLRYVEVKHGRVCQLAFLGQIVTRNGIHLSGDIDYSGDSFDSFPNGIAAVLGPDAIPQAGLLQIVAFVGFLELFVMKDSANGAEPGEFPGDFRNGALDFGWDTFDEETKLSKRGIELNNGRAAMMGILGLMVHEKLGEIDMVADLPIIGALQ